jgi:hypothetical protein
VRPPVDFALQREKKHPEKLRVLKVIPQRSLYSPEASPLFSSVPLPASSAQAFFLAAVGSALTARILRDTPIIRENEQWQHEQAKSYR